MKKYIFLIYLPLLVLFSCRKDNTGKAGADKKLSKVVFKMGFTKSTGTFETNKLKVNSLATNATSSPQGQVDVIYVAVYQTDGTRLVLTTQLSSDSNFGTITENLPAGNYTVVFAAGKTDLLIGGNSTLSSDNLFYQTYIPADRSYSFYYKDTFFKKISLTVGASAISQSVTLDRIVSELIINLNDATPTGVTYLQAIISKDTIANNPDLNQQTLSGALPFMFGTASPAGDQTPILITRSDISNFIGQTNYKICTYIINSSLPLYVRLTALKYNPNSAQNGLPSYQTIAEKNISGIITEINHQTTLSGKLYGGNGVTNTGGFQVTLDPDWDPSVNNIPF